MKAPTPAVDGGGYPAGFFASITADARWWHDFPLVEALRAGDAPYIPREAVVGEGPAPAKTLTTG